MASDDNKTKVTIFTSTYRIKGNIHLVSGARITDYLLNSGGFIAVTDAEVWELGNRHVLTAPFIDVHLDQIQIVMPDEDSGPDTGTRP